MNKHFRVSASTFSKLEELGVRASAVLRRAGLSQRLIREPRLLLTTQELFAFWTAVAEVRNNPAIGLLLGTETTIERFQPIGLAALSAENFGAVVEQMARYKQDLTRHGASLPKNRWTDQRNTQIVGLTQQSSDERYAYRSFFSSEPSQALPS